MMRSYDHPPFGSRAAMPRMALCLLAIAMTMFGAHGAQAQSIPHQIKQVTLEWHPLEHSNGNKVVVDLHNHLHVVWRDKWKIYYATSADGMAWSSLYEFPSASTDPPAIAVDKYGVVGVAWIVGGSLRYSHRAPGSLEWVHSQALAPATEAAIAAINNEMHLVWRDNNRIRYKAFSSLAPPDSITDPELVASLPGASFSAVWRPSIALVKASPSSVLVRIGYLASPNASGATTTTIGPVVKQRVSPTVWNTIFSDTPVSSSNIAPTAVALSLTANVHTGDTFLAWSDSLAGAFRTRLARGSGPSGTLWQVTQLSTTRRHVHVRSANRLDEPTRFRLAWTAAGSGGDNFFGPATYVDSATWTGPTPSWSGAWNLNFPGAGRPQPLFWQRCNAPFTTPTLSSISAYYEAKISDVSFVAVNSFSSIPCPPLRVAGAGMAIAQPMVAFSTISLPDLRGRGTIVATGELGYITSVAPGVAQITTPDGKRATVLWSSGTVSSYSDTSITLTSPRADVRVTSSDVTFDVVELGHLVEYDGPFVGGP